MSEPRDVEYVFDSPGSKIKRTVGFEAAFDHLIQEHVNEEQNIAMLRGDAVTPNFTDVVTTLLKEGLRNRKEWCKIQRQLHEQQAATGSKRER